MIVSMSKTFLLTIVLAEKVQIRKRAVYILYIIENATTRNTESLPRDKMSLKLVQNLAGSVTYQKDKCFRIDMQAFKSFLPQKSPVIEGRIL